MKRLKEGGGRGRKETLADKPLDFENRPHAHQDAMLSYKINQLNLRPSVAEVNFEPKQALTCQNISETKSVRRKNFNDSGRLMQAFKVKFGNL